MFQTVFKRYELKYIITSAQKMRICQAIEPYMQPEKYGRTTVRNVYFDTDSYRLIRRSIEKPVYKEKIRMRSYAQATDDSTVFVELKRKYNDVVYKRRIPLCERDATRWLRREISLPFDTQIAREIDYFLAFYEPLRPAVFLSYEREAYISKEEGSDFRVTFDERILQRQTDLSLTSPVYGEPLLPEGKALMELKCAGGIPLWMAALLSEKHIYKTSFSKYGTAYSQFIFPKIHLKNQSKQEEIVYNGRTF